MKDKFGRVLTVGDRVLKASRASTVAYLELRSVERIENGKVYLDGSKGSYVQNFDLLVKLPPDFFEGLK